MPKNFSLTAVLNIQSPRNLSAVTQQIQRQLGNIKANIQFQINPAAARNLNNLNTAATKLNTTLGTLINTTGQAQAALNSLASTMNINTRALSAFGTQANNLNQSNRQTTTTSTQAASAMENLGKQAAIAIKRYASFSVAAGGVYTLAAAIKASLKDAIEFQHEVIKISQVTGISVDGLKGLTSEVTRLSTSLGVSSKELLNVSQTLAQAGYTAEEVKVALGAIAKTQLAPTFTNATKTVEASIAAMKQFNIGVDDLEKTLGSFNTVAAQFAVEADDIETAVRRSGAAFHAAGGSLNEFVALFTSVRQTTRESAETIATGFRTIFTRLQRPATLNYFKALGVELTDAKGNFIGAYEAVRRLSTAMKDIETTDPRFAKIVEELGGFRQVSKVIPLLQQFEVAEKALGVAIRGEGSLTKDAAKAQESFAIQITKVKEEFSELFRTIAADQGFQGMVRLTLDLTKSFIGLAKSVTPLLPLLTGIFAFKASAGLAQFGRGFAGSFKNKAATGGRVGSDGIHRFARGGLVPGSGSGDIVPAMLEPGEFVLTKTATQRAGLSGVQKFANGGFVQPGYDKTYGLVTLDKNGRNIPSSMNISLNKVLGNNKDLRQSMSRLSEKDKNLSETVNVKGFSVYESAGQSNKITSEFDSSLIDIMKRFSEKLSQKFKADNIGDFSAKRLASIPNRSAMYGSLFEGAIAGLGNPYDITDDQRRFDFPTGVNFTGYGNIKTEAKKSVTKSSLASFKNKIAGDLSEHLDASLLSGSQPQKSAKTPAGDLAAARYQQFKSTGLFSGSGIDAVRKLAKAEGLDVGENRSGGKRQLILRRAYGGGVAGSDSVPALLTPGEFVVNKSAAQSIGYGTLHNMNKVAKFARGGVVGGLGTAAAFAGPQIVSSLFASASDETKQFAGALSAATASLFLFSGSLKSGFGDISKGAGYLGGQGTSGLGVRFIGRGLVKGATPIGLASGILGGSLQSIGQSTGNTKLNSIGGTVGGAGTGLGLAALIAPFFGPAAPIVLGLGAVTGGIYGFLNAQEENTKALNRANFEKNFTSLDTALKDVAGGTGTLTGRGGDISTGITNLRKNFNDPNLRSEAISRASGSSSEIQAIIQKMASTASSLDDVKKASGGLGEELINLYTDINNINIVDFENQIKKSIDSQKKSVAVTLALVAAENEYLRFIKQASGIADTFAKADRSLRDFDNAVVSSIDVLNGNLGASKFEGNFAGIKDFGKTADTADLAASLKQLVTPLGGEGQKFADDVVGISQGIQQLPYILEQLSASDPLGGGPNGQINALNSAIDKFPAVFKSIVSANAQTILNKEDETEYTRGLQENPKELADKLTRDFGEVSKHLEEASQIFSDRVNKMGGQALELARLDLQLMEEKIKADETILEQTRRFAEATDKPFTSTDVVASVDLRRNIGLATGGLGAGSSNKDVADQILKIQRDIATEEKKLQSATASEAGNLQKSLAKLKTQASALNGVLKNTATSFEKANAIQADIGKEKAYRESAQGHLEKFITGGDEERITSLQNFRATQAVGAGANIQDFLPEVRKSVLDIAKEFGESKLSIFGKDSSGNDRTGNEFRKDVVRGQLRGANVPDADIEKILTATPKEQQLLADLKGVFDQMNSANAELEGLITNTSTELSKAFDDSSKRFVDVLKNFFKTQLVREQTDKVTSESNKQTAVGNKLIAASRLNELGGADKARILDSATIKQQQLKEQRKELENQFIKNSRDIFPSFNYAKDESSHAFVERNKNNDDLKRSLERSGLSINDVLGNISSKRNVTANSSEMNSIFEEAVKHAFENKKGNITSQINKLEIDTQRDTGIDIQTDVGIQKAKEAIAALKITGGETVDALTTTLTGVTNTLMGAKDRLDVLQKSRGGVVYRSGGGDIWKKRGSDTVPAMSTNGQPYMLTPGEHIVNAKASRKHRGMLEAMNRGVEYAADGGSVYRIEEEAIRRDLERQKAQEIFDIQMRQHNANIAEGNLRKDAKPTSEFSPLSILRERTKFRGNNQVRQKPYQETAQAINLQDRVDSILGKKPNLGIPENLLLQDEPRPVSNSRFTSGIGSDNIAQPSPDFMAKKAFGNYQRDKSQDIIRQRAAAETKARNDRLGYKETGARAQLLGLSSPSSVASSGLSTATAGVASTATGGGAAATPTANNTTSQNNTTLSDAMTKFNEVGARLATALEGFSGGKMEVILGNGNAIQVEIANQQLTNQIQTIVTEQIRSTISGAFASLFKKNQGLQGAPEIAGGMTQGKAKE